ncbi:L-aspartate oxidase [Antarcticibacterium flavum]|uniref:L-aspartate oxidase n=1 Tax=Antarcticibacterium flavum TaxID=2058175 RepID=A0A5B7X3C8_9FLAO|nr:MULTISPECIES: L-aspartate oxidase [Antarcticibacterium]MCM4158298.1 L-aspartate oxidase [Antarcticibacterium sp. W02-3]QCY70064.1 L-aspartate oxidase [Antarcticibacterium flavum]
MNTDVLVIGSGIAGLSFAIKTAIARPDAAVVVLTKSSSDVCSSSRAQGGIAVVLDRVRDSFEQHIEDTMKAGRGVNDPYIVEMVISQAPERLQELIDWGTSFDANELGELELGLEGGHSQKRIVHHRDLTGKEMVTKLLQKAASLENITFYDHYFVTDLLLNKTGTKSTCVGVEALDNNSGKLIDINSRITYLATGGSGRIFSNTTNPSVATGDGVAMAMRAGAKVSGMNYIQFHPTALYSKDSHALFLISEAVRGYGAHLVNHEGKRFVFKYDPRGELATRDIVSEAIAEELKATGEEYVFLDCRHLDESSFKEHFPTIVQHCTSVGLDVMTDLIPVVPAAHYQCGGIEVNEFSRTSIGNLYAAGECAQTGLHGSNRLASNSLLEALVFSHQAAGVVVRELNFIPSPKTGEEEKVLVKGFGADKFTLQEIRSSLNKLMTYGLLHASGVNEKERALDNIKALQTKLNMFPHSGNLAYFELKNMLQAAQLIVEQAVEASVTRSYGETMKSFRKLSIPEPA